MDIDLKVQKNMVKLSLNIKSYFLLEYIFKGGAIEEASARMPLIFTSQDSVEKEIENLIKKEVIDENININVSLVTAIYFSDVVKPKKLKKAKPNDDETIVVNSFNSLFGKNFKTLKLSTKEKISQIGYSEAIRAFEYASNCSWLESKTSEYWFTIEWLVSRHSDFSDTGKYKIVSKEKYIKEEKEDDYGF